MLEDGKDIRSMQELLGHSVGCQHDDGLQHVSTVDATAATSPLTDSGWTSTTLAQVRVPGTGR